METYHINEIFTDEEVWAILHALSSFLQHEAETEWACDIVNNVREKIINAIE